MSPQIEAAIIAASVGVLTLIATVDTPATENQR
jgi:hypothetical protein